MLQFRSLATQSASLRMRSRNSTHFPSAHASSSTKASQGTNSTQSLSTMSIKRYPIRSSRKETPSASYSHLKSIRTSTSPLPAWTRRWYSDTASEAPKEAKGAEKKEDTAPFATNNPKSRDEIIRQARSFQKQYEEALARQTEGVEADERLQDKNSAFSGFRKGAAGANDIIGLSPRQEGITNADSLRSAQDLKIRRNTVVRKTMWYSLREAFLNTQALAYYAQNRKAYILYALLTAGLLGYVLIRPSPDYDFFNKQQFAEEQERLAKQNGGSEEDASLLSQALDSTGEFVSNFSILEPFKKLGYFLGGMIVSVRLLHQFWAGDPLSEDEKMIAAQTPISMLEDLRPDEYHHTPALMKILATGHIPVEPWRAVIPPSPWAPHLTLVIDTELLYSVGFNSRGERVMRRRPFADYLISSMAENAEIILTSAHHSKTSGKVFFKMFDPYGMASHTLTAEDHRWDGANWLKPLEERFLGRKPSRVVVLDGSYWHSGNMKPNVLRVNYWQGNDSDTTLLELVPVLKYMAAGVEEGMDTRIVINKYEGNSSAKDVIREQLSYTGIEVPADDPLTRRMKEKYSKEGVEPIILSDAEWEASLDRLHNNRVVGPVSSAM